MSRESLADPAGGKRVPDDVIERLLTSERRCHLLSVLLAADDPVPIEDLARAVAARERDATPSAVDDRVVRAVHDEIYETELPKLTAVGLVSFDSLLATVELDTDDRRIGDALDGAT
jgi:hypothetical protein